MLLHQTRWCALLSALICLPEEQRCLAGAEGINLIRAELGRIYKPQQDADPTKLMDCDLTQLPNKALQNSAMKHIYSSYNISHAELRKCKVRLSEEEYAIAMANRPDRRVVLSKERNPTIDELLTKPLGTYFALNVTMAGGFKDHCIALLNQPSGKRVFADPSLPYFVEATAESFNALKFTGVGHTRQVVWHPAAAKEEKRQKKRKKHQERPKKKRQKKEHEEE